MHGYFDAVICAHEFGTPKEGEGFWQKLQRVEPFDTARTLLIDDSLAVLRAARGYGLRHLLAVHYPDSRGDKRQVDEFAAINGFADLLPVPDH